MKMMKMKMMKMMMKMKTKTKMKMKIISDPRGGPIFNSYIPLRRKSPTRPWSLYYTRASRGRRRVPR